MEICIASGGLLKLPPNRPISTQNQTLLPSNSSNRLNSIHHRTNLGLRYYANSSLKSTTSEEASSGASLYVKEETDDVVFVEDIQNVGKNQSADVNESSVDANEGAKEESSVAETDGAKGETLANDEFQPFEFLDKLNIELDSESPFPLLALGGGSLVALWLTTAIVGAIDSIPVLPKLMEVVGLGYSLWFSTRYLLFKENRNELTAKIEEIKQQVLGSDDD